MNATISTVRTRPNTDTPFFANTAVRSLLDSLVSAGSVTITSGDTSGLSYTEDKIFNNISDLETYLNLQEGPQIKSDYQDFIATNPGYSTSKTIVFSQDGASSISANIAVTYSFSSGTNINVLLSKIFSENLKNLSNVSDAIVTDTSVIRYFNYSSGTNSLTIRSNDDPNSCNYFVTDVAIASELTSRGIDRQIALNITAS
jgi:hypothetical protein